MRHPGRPVGRLCQTPRAKPAFCSGAAPRADGCAARRSFVICGFGLQCLPKRCIVGRLCQTPRAKPAFCSGAAPRADPRQHQADGPPESPIAQSAFACPACRMPDASCAFFCPPPIRHSSIPSIGSIPSMRAPARSSGAAVPSPPSEGKKATGNAHAPARCAGRLRLTGKPSAPPRPCGSRRLLSPSPARSSLISAFCFQLSAFLPVAAPWRMPPRRPPPCAASRRALYLVKSA